MVILGIDPGLATIGWGAVDYSGSRFKVLGYGALETPAGVSLEERLLMINQGMKELIERYRPEQMAVEELFFNTNITTGIRVAEARGVILMTAHALGVKLFEYTPLQVKQALTGYGRASKMQIQQMMKSMLALTEIPKPDDVADALAIAVCHGNSMRFNSIKQFGGLML